MNDTTPEAREVQTAVYRRMGGARRVEIALELSELVRDLARARIRQQHPAFDDRAVEDELLWELYGFRRNR